jgi:iron complex transport system ATP-binding protein
MKINTISCKNISLSFDNKNIINDFNEVFEINTLSAIKGLNGTGKSSLLKLITGLNSNYSGNIFYDDKNINQFSSREISNCVSYVGTRNHFTFPISVAELLNTGRYNYQNIFGKISESDHQNILTIVEEIGIMDLYTKNVQNLSDGELQQVMIALALVRDTSFIILDEPTSFLDYKNREKIWNLLVALKNKGKGIIIASHDIFEIEKYADRITELK